MEKHMSAMLTVAMFNEIHQRVFGRAPEFGAPSRSGPDHCPVVSVSLEIDDCVRVIIGQGSNQKLARQNAVDQALQMHDQLPFQLKRAIERKLEGI